MNVPGKNGAECRRRSYATARRGVFERINGAGIWWIRLTDQDGRKQREKTKTYSAAQKLLAKRHTQKLEGKKLPENLRTKNVTFRELCDDALAHSQSENSEKQTYELRLRISQLVAEFGSRSVKSIKKSDIVGWLADSLRREIVRRLAGIAGRRRSLQSLELASTMNRSTGILPRAFAERRRVEHASASSPTRKSSVIALPSGVGSRSSCLTSFSPSTPERG